MYLYDLYNLYDMYDLYDLYDMYGLYDLCDLHDPYDLAPCCRVGVVYSTWIKARASRFGHGLCAGVVSKIVK